MAGKFWDNSSLGMNLASPRPSITVTQILCIMDAIIATAAGSMVIAMIANGSPIRHHLSKVERRLLGRIKVRMNTSNFNFKVFVASVTFLISTLGLVQTASSNGQTFTCSLEPLSFEFYKTNDLDQELTRIFRGGNKVMTTESKLEVHGSGVCRHRIWSFNYYGPITITEMGCYGEITPPDNAVGKISFSNDGSYMREVFCY